MKKLNKCIFLTNAVSIIRSLIISIPFSVFLIKKKLTILLCVYIIYIIYEVFKKGTEYFSVRYGFFETYFIFEKGMFNKRILKIDRQELKYVDSIEFTQSFLYKLLKKYKVILNLKEEEDKKIVIRCINETEKCRFSSFFEVDTPVKQKENIDLVFKPMKKDIIIMSFFSANIFFVLLSSLDYIDNFSYLNIPNKSITMNIYLIVFLTIIVFSIIVLVQILRYGNYSVESTSEYLYKKNGILDYNSKELCIENVNTMVMYQNIFMRWFKVFNIYCLTTKNDNSKNEFKNILFPYIRYDTFKNIVREHSQLKKFEIILEKQLFKYRLFFLCLNTIFFLIFLGVLYLGFFYGYRYWLFLLLIFICKRYFDSFFISILVKEKKCICLVIPGILFNRKVLILLNGIETIRYSNVFIFKKYKLIINSNNLPSKKYILRGVTKTQVSKVFKELNNKEKSVQTGIL